MDISLEDFNKVLDVILSSNYDHRALIEKIARTNPQAIIDSMDETEVQFPLLDAFVRDNQKIQAIKHVRAICGMGLKDSKEFVEDYMAGIGL